MEITAELIKNASGESPSRHDLWLMVKVGPIADNYYAATITFRDPWTYKDISRTKYIREAPTDRDYATMIVHALHCEHPNINFTWIYDNTTRRITVDQMPKFIRSRYGTTMAPPSWHEKPKEENKMELVKIITNGPATIGWFRSPLWSGEKKFIVKKSPSDNYDAEKAVLMLYMKALCGDDTKFHQWMKKHRVMINEALKKEIVPKFNEAEFAFISDRDQDTKNRIKEAADIAKAEEEKE